MAAGRTTKSAAPAGSGRKTTAQGKSKRDSSGGVDAYLAGLPAKQRAALNALRRTIKSIVPDGEEVISYGIPIVRRNGGLVGFAAFATHCGFYVMSTAVMKAHAADLEGYAVGKGSIRFAPDAPLPVSLVKKLVKARIAENDRRRTRSARG